MARSIWVGTLIGALASTWVAWGEPAERTISVQEKDKAAQKCRVLKTWQMEDGSRALQVQALDTGEMMTIVEEGPAAPADGGRARTIATTIFHWGASKTPPPGAPVPPPAAAAHGPSQPRPAPQTHAVAPAVPAGPSSPVAPAMPAPVNPPTPPARVAAPPSLPVQHASVPVSPMPPRETRDAPSSRPAEPVQQPPNYKYGVFSRLFSRETPSKPAVPAPDRPAAAAPLPKTAAEPAQPPIGRQPSGITEGGRTNGTIRPDAPRANVPDTPGPTSARPRPVSSMEHSRTVLPPAAARGDDPAALPGRIPDQLHAGRIQPGPLNHSEQYNQVAQGMPPAPAARTPNPPAAGRPEDEMPADPLTSSSPVPLGAGSVVAAGDVRYLPVPVATMPNVTRMPQTPHVQVPQAPQPNQHMLSNAFMLPPAAVPSAEKANEMVNAFTPADGSMSPDMTPPLMMPPGMVPPNPHARAARGMYLPAPAAPGISPASHGMPAQTGVHPQSAGAVAPEEQQVMATLRDSLYPSQREWAAERMSAYQCRTHPHMVQALAVALKADPAASVRAACARGLARMGARTPEVIAALQALKDDPDAGVRREAEQALCTLAPGLPASGIQPAGLK